MDGSRKVKKKRHAGLKRIAISISRKHRLLTCTIIIKYTTMLQNIRQEIESLQGNMNLREKFDDVSKNLDCQYGDHVIVFP